MSLREPLDTILRMAADGHAFRVIARVLNDTGYTTPRGAQWTHKQVARVCEHHKRRLARMTDEATKRAQEPKVKIDFFRRMVPVGIEYDKDNVPYEVDVPFTGTDEEWAELTARTAKVCADMRAEYERREAMPKDWRLMSQAGITIDECYKAQRFGNLGTAGKDSWCAHVIPLVVEQTLHTGKAVLDLLDTITDHPSEKRLLRVLWLGVMEELAMTRETVLALRAEVKEAVLTATEATRVMKEVYTQSLIHRGLLSPP